MLLKRTNIHEKLTQVRAREFNEDSWEEQVKAIFVREAKREDRIAATLASTARETIFNFDLLDTNRIYYIDQIKKICIDYRLRFLDTEYFKGALPPEAIRIIKTLEREHQTTIEGYKIIAPSKMFKLENEDDPLLFTPIGNDYFYLIHKWGNDLHPARKLLVWSFKSLENLVLLIFLLSVITTYFIPIGLFSKTPSHSQTVIVFLFVFKWIAAIALFYGFALGKNFNPAIWNSKFYNS
ncbi:hypothetical protein ACFSTE_20470 [Aquimarina hainanensis]|uniref:Uncharacterized protein n=1 Tax=Aquimarina hainanensis TaxID=1578017 RepID=A0ABW5NDN1_9FLAO